MFELNSPGTYLLHFSCPRRIRIQVGALKEVELERGSVVYVGSALGPGGLAGRLGHHVRPIRKPRWHIDYLRPHVSLVNVWCVEGRCRREHSWAAVIGGIEGVSIPRAGLGSSDCRCSTHLFQFSRRPADSFLNPLLSKASGGRSVRFLRARLLEKMFL